MLADIGRLRFGPKIVLFADISQIARKFAYKNSVLDKLMVATDPSASE